MDFFNVPIMMVNVIVLVKIRDTVNGLNWFDWINTMRFYRDYIDVIYVFLKSGLFIILQ